MPVSPFDLLDPGAYRRWRDAKLARAPRDWQELVVDVADPLRLSASERQALLQRCSDANMAIYRSGRTEPDKRIVTAIARQLGLSRLDGNWLADEDGITPIAVDASHTDRKAFIPYTDRPIQWHTDGYYQPLLRPIRSMLLHCVRSAASGGDNLLMDHEMAYLALRDADPDWVRAWMAPEAMMIPARAGEDGVARAERCGPVFSVDAQDGRLHMRFTARTRSIAWKDDAATRAAVAFLRDLLQTDSAHVLRVRLEPGMGLVCNNVLHARSAFTDDPDAPRLLYRARYLDRIASLVPDDVGISPAPQQTRTHGLAGPPKQERTHEHARAVSTEPVDRLQVASDGPKDAMALVTLRPSGHRFAVQGQANLLQSGLQAGLKLNYGCGNGNCGMCKVRLITGEVRRTAPSDYPLSEVEKALGYTLMCCHTAASGEVTLELLEAGGPQDIAVQEIVATVRALRTLDADTRLLHLQTPRTHRLRFLAGQSVELACTLPAEANDVRRSLPVASCPCDDRNLHFFVTRDDNEPFARLVFGAAIRLGDAITVRGPTGRFVLAEVSRPLVFAACNIGFAPIKSLIEQALALDPVPSLSLFWLATSEGGHFLANQCRAWSAALDTFEYELMSDPDPVEGARRIAQAMRVDLFDIDCDFYLAGPQDFVTTLAAQLREVGVAAGQICSEVV